jgi:hypothetical protein
MAELIFEVTQETDGGYCAECLTLDIFTQGDTWDELRSNVRKSSAPTSSITPFPSASVCTSPVTKCSRPYENTPCGLADAELAD